MSERSERPDGDLERDPELEPDAPVAEQAAFAAALDVEAPPSPEPAGLPREVEPSTARPNSTARPFSTVSEERANRPTAELTFVGTATLVLRLGDFTILTDPNFVHRGRRVHLGPGVTARRRTNPAMDLNDLPPLDLVLVSHLHGDHFDRLTAALLDRAVPIVTTRDAARRLNMRGFRDVQGLATWRALDIRKGDTRLRVTAMPAKHAPWPLELALPKVMGSLIDVFVGREQAYRLYITGDTLVHDRLRQIPRRFQNIDLAVLHLGGMRIAGVKVTMDGRDGVECLRTVAPKAAIPVHFDDYPVFRSPLSQFRSEVERAGLSHRVRYVGPGDTVDLWELAETVDEAGRAARHRTF